MRKILVLIFGMTAAACAPVSYSHVNSEAALTRGLQERIVAEKAAVDFSKQSSPVSNASGRKTPDLASPHSTRVALADDGRKDYEMATGQWANATDADRVSALLRAGRKTWYAGKGADLDLAVKIASAGSTACNRISNFKPDRDCALIAVMPYLTVMQYYRDVILDVEIERLSQATTDNPRPVITDQQAIDQALAITKLNKESRLLDGQNIARPDIEKFVDNQQIAYWCVAMDGMWQFSNGSKWGANETRKQAQALLLGMDEAAVPPELAEQLSSAGLSVAEVNGAYTEFAERALKLANAGGVPATDIADHKIICKPLQG